MTIKKIFLILLLLNCNCAIAQKIVEKQKLVDLYGEKVKININKKCIIVVFSSASCHNCYLQLNSFFTNNNLWDKEDIDIIAIVNVSKEEVKNVTLRKSNSDRIHEYFPNIKKIYFNTKEKKGQSILFDYPMDCRRLPNVFIVKDKTLTYYNDYNLFGKGTFLLKEFKTIILAL